MEVHLVILSPSGTHRTRVKRLPLPVGRADEATCRISQDCVSRRPRDFRQRDGRLIVRDLTSTNGTIVAGEPDQPEWLVAAGAAQPDKDVLNDFLTSLS